MKSVAYIFSGLLVGFVSAYLYLKPTPESEQVFALYGEGQKIKGQEVLERISIPLRELERSAYNLKKSTTQKIILEKLGQNTELGEVAIPRLEPESDKFKNRRTGNNNRAREKRKILNSQALKTSQIKHQEQLNKKLLDAKIQWKISDPDRITVKMDTGTLSPRGDDRGNNKIIVFSNYNCPFCSLTEKRLNEVLEKHGDKVQIHHRFFISDHNSELEKKSIQAAFCADDQGQFLKFHSSVFAKPVMIAEDLQRLAEEAGLNSADFSNCLESNRFAKKIEMDIKDSQKIQIQNVPLLIINDQVLSGLSSLESIENYLK